MPLLYSSSISKLYAIGVGYLINLESFLRWCPDSRPSITEIARRSDGPVRYSDAARWVRWLEGLIFFFLILFAILLPHSIKGARHAWMAAGFLWLAKLAIERKRPFPQPLVCAAAGLHRLERNFDRALARSLPELAAHESRVPGAGRNCGRTEPATAVAGAHPGVAVAAFRPRGRRLSQPGNTPTASECR